MRSYYLLLIAFLIEIVSSKIFEKCELARLLEKKYRFSRDAVKKWVCIAQYESTFNTAAINHYNWDGSKDYGLFQLNNRYWCGSNSGKNVCNIPCAALLDDDITDDIECTKKIIEDTVKWMDVEDGLLAWVAYRKECVNRNLDEYMKDCWGSGADISSTGPTVEQSLSENIIPIKESPSEASDNAPSRASAAGQPSLPVGLSQLRVHTAIKEKVVAPAIVRSEFIMIPIKPSDSSFDSIAATVDITAEVKSAIDTEDIVGKTDVADKIDVKPDGADKAVTH